MSLGAALLRLRGSGFAFAQVGFGFKISTVQGVEPAGWMFQSLCQPPTFARGGVTYEKENRFYGHRCWVKLLYVQ